MLEQLTILAEGAHEGGIPAAAVGIGTFVILMCLLGITTLTSGLNQNHRSETEHHDS